jgi:hypothetical protein
MRTNTLINSDNKGMPAYLTSVSVDKLVIISFFYYRGPSLQPLQNQFRHGIGLKSPISISRTFGLAWGQPINAQTEWAENRGPTSTFSRASRCV